MNARQLRAWWSTAHSSVITHRRLKWLWVALIPLSYLLRGSVAWVVFISHYALIVGHWSSEEAAITGEKQDDEAEE